MNDNPLVSIIIPAYNRAHIIGVAIESVMNQTYQNWECIIVDDGSDDNTEEVVNKFIERDARFIWLERNRQPKGASTCRNIGAEHASGVYLIFLDSDDYLLPFCIENRVNQSILNPNYNFYEFPMGIKNGNITKKEIPIKNDYLIDFLSYELHWQTMCVFWDKEYFLTLKFNPSYPRYNDPELMIRAMTKDRNGYKVFLNAPFDSVYIPSEFNTYRMMPKVYESLSLLFNDIAKNKSITKTERKIMMPYFSYWFYDLFLPLNSLRFDFVLKLIYLMLSKGIMSIFQLIILLPVLIFGFIASFFHFIIRKWTKVFKI